MGICESDRASGDPGQESDGMGGTLAGPPAADPVDLYLARLARSSRRTQGQAVRVLVAMLDAAAGGPLPWSKVRYPHTLAVRALLVAAYRPATANRMLCALRGVLHEAWRLGLLTAEDYARCIDLTVVRGCSLPAGRTLVKTELKALFAACLTGDGVGGVRDASVLAVLMGAGLRREEAVLLDVEDLNPRTGELRVRGKGNKDRQVFAAPGALAVLRRWLGIRGQAPGPMFLPLTKAGGLGTHRLTPQALYYLLKRRGAQARVAPFSPHDLRRTFCTSLLEAGVDIATVAGLMGHASIDTTKRYDRRDLRARRRAVRLLEIPISC